MPDSLERAIAALHAVDPELDATALAEALWLASRMDVAVSPGSPDALSGAQPTTATEDPEPFRNDPPVQAGMSSRTTSTASDDSRAERALHERLPGSTAPVRGNEVGLVRASPLPLALEVTRALRPWKRPWRKGRHQTLDVEATVNNYARSGELIPAFTTAAERWFDLVVVVDRSPSMQVWQESVEAFTTVLDQLGAFRTLQTRDLTFADGSGPELRDRQDRPTTPGQLQSPTGRRLVLVVSDCAARAWRAPSVWCHLREWSLTTPVALLNPLPAKLWRRTGLDLPSARVTPGRPGAANGELGFTLPPLLPSSDNGDRDGWQPIPVLSLSPHSLGRWSRTVMRAAPEGCGAVLVPPTGRAVGRRHARSTLRSIEARTEGFLRTAAPAAARLAVLCSPFDRLSLGLLHLIRQELVTEATTADIAEVLTAGIFELETDMTGSALLVVPRQVQSRLGRELREYEWRRVRRTLSYIPLHAIGRRGLPAVAQGAQGTKEIRAEPMPFGYVLSRPVPKPSHEPTTATALRLACALLPTNRQATPQEVTAAANAVVTMLADRGLSTDRAALLRELESQISVFQESAALLENSVGHEPWLERGTDDRMWDFWERYKRYLLEVRQLPPRVVQRLDESTHKVLARIEDPRRPGAWRRTGLVIGQPQSGKTDHYIGLTSKAVDAGYRLIVIIAGPNNAQRVQTQLRVDEGLLGFDTLFQTHSIQGDDAVGRRIGVGAMSHAKMLGIASMTNSSEKGDFNPRLLGQLNFPVGGIPLVFVVKKNRRIIENLRDWLTAVHGTDDPATGETTVQDVPLFIIDDDVDGSYGPLPPVANKNPSATDESIRGILASFKRSAYIGYGSTALAGMYADPVTDHGEDGLSLFPDSFVYSLRPPSSYLGPERLFGTQNAQQHGKRTEALPLVRYVTDHEDWVPTRHPAAHVPGTELPGSLREAIDAFVLACAARRARGQISVHNSMLVRVSRFIGVQTHVRDQVEARVRLVADTLRDGNSPAAARQMAAFKALWLSDFSPTSEVFPSDEATVTSWEEVAEHVWPAVRKIQVGAANGASRDVLAYAENAAVGVNTIAIAGSQPPQGLTLEGLTVAYVLRSSRTYESWLHVSRWFGYRVGYEDLCRLYITPDLERAYLEVASSAAELHRNIERMGLLGMTPQQFGLKVRSERTVPELTAFDAPRREGPAVLSYSGRAPETVHFSLSRDVLRSNFQTLERFVASLDALGSGLASSTGSVMWNEVPPTVITTKFLDEYLSVPGTQLAQPARIADYVRRRADVGELGRWTVRLVSSANSPETADVASHRIGLVTRKPFDPFTPFAPEGVYVVRRLLNPRDESMDLDQDQYAAALEATRARASRRSGGTDRPQEPRVPTGVAARAVRRADQPLLLIYPLRYPFHRDERSGTPVVGFAVSFPHSTYWGG
ncbi:SAV_2336 N-terminal domain-related protein [Streptomyces coeruleorubidus]|uniref:SAV_2336 N-terminal domain-related protein n=1 Tax=Streptomyces coeruleorubidus TaxID=116188 RepID=UPI0037A6B904